MQSTLDDAAVFPLIDRQNMLGEIEALPDQLTAGWDTASRTDLRSPSRYEAIILSGMGGSAIGADLASSFLGKKAHKPIWVHRDYGLPEWVRGDKFCVVTSSHSGNTEETLSTYAEARNRGCHQVAICTGGELLKRAENDGVPMVCFSHQGQPRAAVGYAFGILLNLFEQLGICASNKKDLERCADFLKQERTGLGVNTPVVQNPAKRLAGQMAGRYLTIIGADFFIPVARRWKGQINELAKAWCQFDSIPEANHNTLAGVLEPTKGMDNLFVTFVTSGYCLPRNQKRIDLMNRLLLTNGIGSDIFRSKGGSDLEQMWYAVLFGDYLAYYLAMIYQQDPTPIPAISAFKANLG